MCSRQQRSPERRALRPGSPGRPVFSCRPRLAGVPLGGRLFATDRRGSVQTQGRHATTPPILVPASRRNGPGAGHRSHRAHGPASGQGQAPCRCADDDGVAPPPGVSRHRPTRLDSPDPMQPAPSTPSPHAPSWRDDPPGSPRLRTMGTATLLDSARTTPCRRRDPPLSQRPGTARDGRPTGTHAPACGTELRLAARRRHTQRTRQGAVLRHGSLLCLCQAGDPPVAERSAAPAV